MELKSGLKLVAAAFAGWEAHKHKDQIGAVIGKAYSTVSGKLKDLTGGIKTTVDNNQK